MIARHYLLLLLLPGLMVVTKAQQTNQTDALPLTARDAQLLLRRIPASHEGFMHLRERSELQRRKLGGTARAERVFRQKAGGGLYLMTVIQLEHPDILKELSPPLFGREAPEGSATETSVLKDFLGKPAYFKEITDRNMSMIQSLQAPNLLVEWRGIKLSLADLETLAQASPLADENAEAPKSE